MSEKPKARGRLSRMLLMCPNACGGLSKDARTAKGLRKARSQCSELQRRALLPGPEYDSVPIEHIRAAERHLAMVERWLLGQVEAEAEELMALQEELGSSGFAHEGDTETFMELFKPAVPGEILLKAMPCLTKSGSLNYPGKLYMSSTRLCFHASLLGITARFEIPWIEIATFRLVAEQTRQTHNIRVSLKNAAGFDGKQVEHIIHRLFDLKDVGHFHKCATFFTGSGLFGLWNSSDSPYGIEPESPSMRRLTAARGRKTRTNSSPTERTRFGTDFEQLTSPTKVRNKLETDTVMWELERRYTIWNEEWHAPFLPHDNQKKIKWLAIVDEQFIPHPFLSEESRAAVASTASKAEPPVDKVEFMGREREVTSWEVILDETGDDDGWQYAFDFYLDPAQWTDYCAGFSHVRRRRWQPDFACEDDEKDRIPPIGRENTTILSHKGLKDKTTEIFDVDLGVINFVALANAFESDDWMDPSSLMQSYFEAVQATELEIGPWESLHSVQGRARSVDLRAVVPPNPMCPKDTRCTSTWHVVNNPSNIVLESVTMSLDVPYGTTFNVIVCDKFTLQASGHVRMVRSFAVDWVTSIWLTSMVEQGVPPPLKDVAEKFSALIQQYMIGK